MGWISPIIITGKIFMQLLWKSHLKWDDPLPVDLSNIILEYFNSLPQLSRITIPRWTGFSLNIVNAQIHGFSDASEKAYGAVVYLRVLHLSGKVTTSILSSKTKVAPIKQLSIPRLELQAALVLAKLLDSIRDARLLSTIPFQCWTDSSIVLAWLSQHASNWKTFIANRISIIQSLLPEHNWRHIPSESNPADLLSRGKSVIELVDSPLLWNGPPWLPKADDQWPVNLSSLSLNINLEEKIKLTTNHATPQTYDPLTKLISSSTSWRKLLRDLASLNKLVNIVNLKIKKLPYETKALNANDLNFAESQAIKYIQKLLFPEEILTLKSNKQISVKSKLSSLNPFLENGVIKVGGRLSHSDLPIASKYPILLSRHRLTTLIIEDAHLRCLHGGVHLTLSTLRNQYWVLSPRSQVKSVVHKCITCAKMRATLSQQIMADLPCKRVTQPSRVFTDCGVDYAGPLQVRLAADRGHKSQSCYIALFVCFAIKAVHLELVSDYSTDAFIYAFKRFTSRCGLPARMYSDCGTNFYGADGELKLAFEHACKSSEFQFLLAPYRVSWHINPPSAPHLGGLWEVGVRSVKGHLKRILGNKTPTFEELTTLLCQIESVLNSRPLSPLTDHIDGFDALTPGHFMVGGSLIAVPQPSLIDLNVNRLSRWQQMQQCYELFWQRWSTDYLQSLQRRSKWRFEKKNLKQNQLVLIKQANLPSTKWLLGRTVECCPSRDSKVRTVRVKTTKSTFLHPISSIALLPLDLESHSDHTTLLKNSV